MRWFPAEVVEGSLGRESLNIASRVFKVADDALQWGDVRATHFVRIRSRDGVCDRHDRSACRRDAVRGTPTAMTSTADSPPADAVQRRRLLRSYAQWCLFLVSLLVATTGVMGAGIDRLQPLPPRALFAALTLASVLGAVVAGIIVWPWMVRPIERLALMVVLYLAWRICYLPWMQLAVLGAGEIHAWLVRSPLPRPWVYPTLLALLALLHLLAGGLAVWPLATRRPVWALLVWPLFVPAAMMSFCDWHDLHPLPDRSYQGVRTAAVASLPVSNPYRKPGAAGQRDSGWNRRLRDWLAAQVYELRGDSPWMQVVQGTLEREARQRPPASSTLYLQRYYAALIVAHDFVGQRVIVARSPGSDRGPVPRFSAIWLGKAQLERKGGSW